MNYYEKQQAFERQHAAELVEVENGITFYPGEEPSGEEWDYGCPDLNLGTKRSEITGNLKEMVLKRAGIDTSFGTLDHKVEIIETHENGGYCGSCAFEYLVFTILVDGEEVYGESFSDNPFGVLQDWLTEDDEDDE